MAQRRFQRNPKQRLRLIYQPDRRIPHKLKNRRQRQRYPRPSRIDHSPPKRPTHVHPEVTRDTDDVGFGGGDVQAGGELRGVARVDVVGAGGETDEDGAGEGYVPAGGFGWHDGWRGVRDKGWGG